MNPLPQQGENRKEEEHNSKELLYPNGLTVTRLMTLILILIYLYWYFPEWSTAKGNNSIYNKLNIVLEFKLLSSYNVGVANMNIREHVVSKNIIYYIKMYNLLYSTLMCD